MSKASPQKRRRKRLSRTLHARKRHDVRKSEKPIEAAMRHMPRVVIDPNRTWLVARVVPRLEMATAFGLAYFGAEPYVPCMRLEKTVRGRSCTVDHHPIPGYVFAGFVPVEGENPHTRLWEYHQAEVARGFVGPLLATYGPIRVNELQRFADWIAEDAAPIADPDGLRVGQEAVVTDGPFASFPAVILEMLKGGAVLAEVSVFGRSNPVEFEPGQLRIA